MAAPASILLTPGEPAGIGPELAVKAAQRQHPLPVAALCDPTLLEKTAVDLNLALEINIVDGNSVLVNTEGAINVIPVPLAKSVTPGTLDTNNADYVLKTLERAAELCLSGHFSAVVTGPVQKSVINDAGHAFTGHTEYFAEKSGTEKVVMMLATSGLRVALATTHLPLKDVPQAINADNLQQVLSILIRELQSKFAIQKPKILVAGLNPHAGEGGHLGEEEITTIIPVMESLADQEAELIGPLPADTLFTPRFLQDADCVLAMYHDQGLPVLKHKGFGKAVNITLGLPFIRTSVDHGTALDLAGKGLADESSLLEAIAIACELARNRIN